MQIKLNTGSSNAPGIYRKIVVTKRLALMLLTIICLFTGCRDKSTSNSRYAAQFHASDCISSNLGKSTNGMAADSIFNYNFTSLGLDLDFSVGASCGRAENSFIINHIVRGDTIDFSVIDTCNIHAKCPCLYMITADNLPFFQDRYMVRCTYYDSVEHRSYVAHFVEVHR
jgi:hypothetical protein